MGLSRNKVAVSEGAAGSPPFYGEHGRFSRAYRIRVDLKKRREDRARTAKDFLNRCSIFSDRKSTEYPLRKWGCSSAGRAPALQAGGHGFDSHHLHQEAQASEGERVRETLFNHKGA